MNIKTAISLYDGVTGPLRSMQRAMNVMLNSFEAMQRASSNAVDTSAIENAQSRLSALSSTLDSLEPNQVVTVSADVQQAQTAISSLKNALSSTSGGKVNVSSITAAQSELTRLQSNLNKLSGTEHDVTVSADIEQAQAALSVLKTAIESTSGSVEVEASSIQYAREELAKAETAFESIESSINDDTKAQRTFNSEINNGTNAASELWGKLKSIAATLGVGKAVKELASLSDTLSGTKARLSLIVDDGGSVEELEKKIMASATRSRAAYLDTADAIASMGANAGNAFSSNDELIAFMEQVNKQFAIGGASAQGQAAAMLQLTQAMSMGALRGEELNSILENAPGIARAIENEMGWAEGSIKNYASEGAVTADVVKKALLGAADETNAAFESIPKTWAQIWTDMQNKALSIFSPILQKINDLANNDSVQTVADSLMGTLGALSNVASIAINALSAGLDFVVNNWNVLVPIITAAAAALLLYNGYLTAHNILEGISNGLKAMAAINAAAHGAAITAEMAATAGMTQAQLALNAALLSSPVTWVVVGIIAVIAALYAVVAVINNVTGQSISATGLIAGSVTWLCALVLNSAIGLFNGMIQFLYTIFVYPFLSIIEWVLNAANGGFNSFGAAVANLIGQIIGWFLSLGQVVTTIIDAIFGTDWTSGLQGLKENVVSWGKNENAITIDGKDDVMTAINSRINMTDAFHTGYDWGTGVEDSIAGIFDASSYDAMGAYSMDAYNLEGMLDGINNAATNTAANTAKAAKSLEVTDEDLKYLRDIAEREAINRFTTAEIKIEQNNSNNISKDVDLDGVMDIFATGLAQRLDIQAEGVHA